MNMVDDATGRTYSFFCEEEMSSDAMRLLWGWIARYGIPQAKGHVERSHGVYQDSLAEVSTIEDASRSLEEVYLPKVNEKFAKALLRPQDAHVPLTTPTSLEDILCYETPRG